VEVTYFDGKGGLYLNYGDVTYVLEKKSKIYEMPQEVKITNMSKDLLNIFDLSSYKVTTNGFADNTYFIEDNYAIINNCLCEIDYKYNKDDGDKITIQQKKIKRSIPIPYLNTCVNCYRRSEMSMQSLISAKNIILKTAESEKWEPIVDINTATDYAIIAAYIVAKINIKIQINYEKIEKGVKEATEEYQYQNNRLNRRSKIKKYANNIEMVEEKI
jgi:hypothetical protein